MAELSWRAAADGRYWIDVSVGGEVTRVMVDLGLVDPSHAVGFELEPDLYDRLKQSGRLSRFQLRYRRDANGGITRSESGLTTVQLVDPTTGLCRGAEVRVHVCRGAESVPSRVGVVFFHRLTGCQVRWNLDDRTWQIVGVK